MKSYVRKKFVVKGDFNQYTFSLNTNGGKINGLEV